MEEIIPIICILFLGMVIHEFAHAWVANQLGDSTAKLAGRMTLNPIKHIDPFGTIVLPVVLTVLRFLGSPFFPIALAKPVPVNFLKLRHPKRDMIWVAGAGPAVNILLAVCFSVGLKFHLSSRVYEFFGLAVFINLILAVFNMIPIPPLDGSRILTGLLPDKLSAQYSRLERYGILIIFVLLPLGLFQRVVVPVTVFCGRLLGVQF